jgi:hypothetical protein
MALYLTTAFSPLLGLVVLRRLTYHPRSLSTEQDVLDTTGIGSGRPDAKSPIQDVEQGGVPSNQEPTRLEQKRPPHIFGILKQVWRAEEFEGLLRGTSRFASIASSLHPLTIGLYSSRCTCGVLCEISYRTLCSIFLPV